jgi:hypothetical protein
MRLAFLALALTLPAASPAQAPTSPTSASPSRTASPALVRAADTLVPSRICDLGPRHARTPAPAKAKRLGELPSGDLVLAVVNRVGDCIEPMTVRQGYGPGGR